MNCKFCILCCLLLFLLYNCSGNNNPVEHQNDIINEQEETSKENIVPSDIIGKWKLIGVGNTKNTDIKNLQPEGDRVYELTLFENGKVSGYTSTNTMYGDFFADEKEKTLSFSKDIIFTEINELQDGKLYVTNLLNVKFYTLYNENIHLFYDENNYLIFKHIKP